jgi:hypothetical protein
MNYYSLIYHLTDDYLERRPQFRAEHLQLAADAQYRANWCWVVPTAIRPIPLCWCGALRMLLL